MFSHMESSCLLSLPGNQETGALAKVRDLCFEVPFEATRQIHIESGYQRASMEWKIAKVGWYFNKIL